MSRKPSRVCFVGCLGSKTTEEDIYEFFKSKIGGVEAVNLKRDSSGNSRRFALVTFDNPEYAQRAIDELDDTRFNNTIIHVESYKTKRQQNYERDEEYREELLSSERAKHKEEKSADKEEDESDESNYSSSSSSSASSSSSSSSSSSKRRKKHRHHHRHHSSSSDKKSKGKRHHHHRHHRSHH